MSSSKYLKAAKQVLRFLPDRAYLQLYYFGKFRRLCDFRNPVTYNEKLQWLKVNYRIPEHSRLVDKHEVKQAVADLIGSEYIIPTIGLYDSADDIDFADLPESFVLKCTHDSEGVVLVDKDLLDVQATRERLRRLLTQNFYNIGREPHYRDLRPRVIAEPLLEDATHGQLLDYKFFCFDGEVKAMYIASDRSTGNIKFDYFDENFVPLDLRQSYPTSDVKPQKPATYDEMLKVAKTLAQGHPHVRVDLYEVNGQVYFGELTFFHFSGFSRFHPPHWDRLWGDWLTLPAPVNPV